MGISQIFVADTALKRALTTSCLLFPEVDESSVIRGKLNSKSRMQFYASNLTLNMLRVLIPKSQPRNQNQGNWRWNEQGQSS
mmetsp:Transcript_37960/g.43021  ORF Transcript_37960/g.43021 Transcript_37960/m.43021 type:complete len:82 (+) Transcript_37960:729-974(+)